MINRDANTIDSLGRSRFQQAGVVDPTSVHNLSPFTAHGTQLKCCCRFQWTR